MNRSSLELRLQGRKGHLAISLLILQQAKAFTNNLAGGLITTGRDALLHEPIKIADGTTVDMPDTPENQKAYPQQPSQKPLRLAGACLPTLPESRKPAQYPLVHPHLLQSLRRLQDHYARDERCLGAFLSGSIGAGTTDDWSDVDLDAVFRDQDYPAAKAECRAVCESLCGPILVWLPEGEGEHGVNFAFLYEAQGRSHLYDFTICDVTSLKHNASLRPQNILFDKAGLLAEASKGTPARSFNPADLLHQIHVYWVYAYLNGKYYKRGDAYKMLYVQQVIFPTHLRVLNALYPDTLWNWWARDVHALPAEKRAELLVYFGANHCDTLARALETEIDLFSRDAQAACARHAVPYPADLERGVREHLAMMDVTHR